MQVFKFRSGAFRFMTETLAETYNASSATSSTCLMTIDSPSDDSNSDSVPADSSISVAVSATAATVPRLGTPEFEAYSKSLDKRPIGYRIVKRAFDLIFSILVLAACVLLLPLTLILLIVIAVQTKASPIYVQERVGRYGKPMKIFKLRSMVKDSDNVEKYLNDEQLVQWRKERKVDDDTRVVPIGKVIRKTSIDEFANVLNVLAGQMSVIGPRPISYEEMRWFTPQEQAELLAIPGGVTGLWQATSRNEATFESGERQAIELEYVETASFKTDWRVFKGTFRAMFLGTGR